ncbi:hypothetical protein [Streptomyces exfoliatus]|uniref:hypothetical protein n=1 Tax=Streptomyces exfoliatus TaxID=1905 RepID=UPI0037AF1517
MIIIGLLLLLAAGAFTGLLIADNISGGPKYDATVLDNTVATVNPLGAFLAGIGIALVLGLALALILAGTARRRRAGVRGRRTAYRRPEAPPREDAPAEPASGDGGTRGRFPDDGRDPDRR